MGAQKCKAANLCVLARRRKHRGRQRQKRSLINSQGRLKSLGAIQLAFT